MNRSVESAHAITIGICGNPECSLPHIILYDANDEPFAVAVIGNAADLIGKLQDVAYVAATNKDLIDK
jgi:hypothetical protein